VRLDTRFKQVRLQSEERKSNLKKKEMMVVSEIVKTEYGGMSDRRVGADSGCSDWGEFE
jgi:hypothetical protein